MQQTGVTIRPWTTGELALLREHACCGAAEVARLLDRSEGSVRAAAARQRISLRRRGSRRGLIMGQPRGVSLRRELRDDLLRGRRDELLEVRAALDAEAALCPACGVRPARSKRSGWCLVCHLKRTARLYDELTEDDEALRQVWAARQRRKAALDALDAAGAPLA